MSPEELPAEAAVEEAHRRMDWRKFRWIDADLRRDAASAAVIFAVICGLIFNGLYIAMLKRQVDENTQARFYMEKRVEQALKSHAELRQDAREELDMLRRIGAKVGVKE